MTSSQLEPAPAASHKPIKSLLSDVDGPDSNRAHTRCAIGASCQYMAKGLDEMVLPMAKQLPIAGAVPAMAIKGTSMALKMASKAAYGESGLGTGSALQPALNYASGEAKKQIDAIAHQPRVFPIG